jgi:hypothetical protein
MSHHSSEQNRELSEAMRQLLGEYPNGRMNADDAGAIAMQVGVESGRVVMRFPKLVSWIGFTGDEAMEIAQLLITHARKAGITAPAVIRIGE